MKGSNHKEASLKRALNIITMWLLKNVGGDQSKYLKMQKLLLVQTLSLRRALAQADNDQIDIVGSDDKTMALNFRLI